MNVEMIEDTVDAQTTIQTTSIALVQGASMTPGQLVTALMDRDGPPDLQSMERLMALQERWEANEARKAYHAAMAEFKRNPPKIIKDKHVKFTSAKGVTEYDHATIGNVVRQIIESLAQHDLSHSWSTEQVEGGQVAVTCTITHKAGHSESITLKAGRDESGGKNAIQALGSAITYLQRYTVLAITGLAVEDGSDDDGKGAGEAVDGARLEIWTLRAQAAKNPAELLTVRKTAGAAFDEAKDLDGWNSFKAVYADCKAAMQKVGAA